jgi:hypothetical protein
MPEWLCVARDNSFIVQYVLGYYCTVLLTVSVLYWRCALYIVSIWCICFYCAIAKKKKVCGQYWIISIEYSVDGIEQYPLNILLSILSNIHWIFCEKYWVIHFEYSADSIEQYPSNILWTVLCNVYCMLAVLRYAH